MLRKLTVLLMSVLLCWTAIGCGSSNTVSQQNSPNYVVAAPAKLAAGEYPVQQASYNDGDGEYSLMLLNTPPGTPPILRTANLQMARLTDDEIKAGKKSYLKTDGTQPVLYLTEDFKIEYTHNVVETKTNPQTGERQTIVVRQESNFWTPFAGAIAGQMVANALFRPTYYVPPMYQPGMGLIGYGGYGNTYGQAVSQYQTRYQAPPPAVKNRQVFRSSGNINSPSSNRVNKPVKPNSNRSTGSGFGTSNLRGSGNNNRPKRSSGFGSGVRRSPVRMGGGRRR